MKKLISAVLSAAMTLSAVAVPAASAENKKADNSSDGRSFVVLGDSIGSGYGLGAGEYDYGELIADYYGGTVSNFAHAGDDTDDLLALLASPTAEMSAALESADDVLISIGGNNMIYYAANQLLQVCANIGVLSEGYTAADIPEEPSFNEVFRMVDTDALKEYASDLANQMKLSQEIQRIRANLVMTEGEQNSSKYRRIIETEIIPDIETIVTDIKTVNPDANIVVQTVYDPLQFEKSYYESAYTGSRATFMNQLIPVFTIVTESFRDQLVGAAIDGVTVVDIYDEFTSLDANGNKYSWYFTKIQNDRKDMDFHPTQAGHVAIAARIIDTLGVKDNSGRLIVKTFEDLPDKNYPAAALETYKRVTANTAPEPVADPRFVGTWELYSVVDENGEEQYDNDSTKFTIVLKDDFTGTVKLWLESEPLTAKLEWTSEGDIASIRSLSTEETLDFYYEDGVLRTKQKEQYDYYFKRSSALALGDPNNDGFVNSSDASFVLAAYAKLSVGNNDLTDEEFAACDVNKDTKVDSADATLILAYYAYVSTGGDDSFEKYVSDTDNQNA